MMRIATRLYVCLLSSLSPGSHSVLTQFKTAVLASKTGPPSHAADLWRELLEGTGDDDGTRASESVHAAHVCVRACVYPFACGRILSP